MAFTPDDLAVAGDALGVEVSTEALHEGQPVAPFGAGGAGSGRLGAAVRDA